MFELYVCLCVQDEQMPLVYVAVFIEHATPFMEEFLERLSTLNYPKTRIRLFIHNNVRCTLAQSSSFTALTGTSEGRKRFTIKESELSHREILGNFDTRKRFLTVAQAESSLSSLQLWKTFCLFTKFRAKVNFCSIQNFLPVSCAFWPVVSPYCRSCTTSVTSRSSGSVTGLCSQTPG